MYKEILAGNTSTIDVGRIYMCLGQAYADKFFPCGLQEGEGIIFLKNAIEKEYYEAVRIFALLGKELDEGYRKWLFEFSAQHQDNPYCAFAMGICYENGYGTFKDYNSAFNYYKKSADLGDPWGMHCTAGLYLKGQGVEESVDEWFRLETQAAEGGVPPAQYNIGIFYLRETRTEQSLEKAKRFLKSAADNHYDDAIRALKEMPAFGFQEESTSPQVNSQPIQQSEQKPEIQRTVQNFETQQPSVPTQVSSQTQLPSEQKPEIQRTVQNFETQQPSVPPQVTPQPIQQSEQKPEQQ